MEPMILFVVTSHATIGDTGRPTGLWLEELAAPYYAFIDAGYEVEIASIKGGKVPVDPRSQKPIGGNAPTVERFLKDAKASARLADNPSIDALDVSRYAVVFLPGGHGAMWDMPESKALARAIVSTLERGNVVAAVCHGSAGLVNARFENGEPVVKGREICAFTNSEEEAAGLAGEVPFLLETRLEELGARIHKAPNFQPLAVADGNLITGQNPASSEVVAKFVIRHLQSKYQVSALMRSFALA